MAKKRKNTVLAASAALQQAALDALESGDYDNAKDLMKGAKAVTKIAASSDRREPQGTAKVVEPAKTAVPPTTPAAATSGVSSFLGRK